MYAFIVRPFGVKQGVDFDRVDRELIQPALRAAGVVGETTAAITEAGNIREDMFGKLLTADLVIADVSVHNANVFYELGIRHALRDRKTILLRCSDEGIPDIPFDLKTDRYLSYTLLTLKTDARRLKLTIQETLHSDRKDSPIFSLLPHLKAQDPEQFLVAPADFYREVMEARLNKQEGKLGLLAAETTGFPWELSGLRLVGEIQFEINSLTGARLTWERIAALVPDDEQANDRLSTIYQQLSEQYAHTLADASSPCFTLLTLSDQAIDRLLIRPELSSHKRAEIYSLKGRNNKFRWVNEWQFAPPEAFRQQALASSYLLRAYEAYAQAFTEDLNHFFSGINALGLLTVILDLAETDKPIWEEHFDDSHEAERSLQAMQRRHGELVTVVEASLAAARHRKYSHGERDSWLDLTAADLRCLTLNKPRRVSRLYQDVISGADPFFAHSTHRQLELYQKLRVRGEIVDAVLAQLDPVAVPLAHTKPYMVVFTGHMIDREGRPPRFPAGQEERAKEEIRRQLRALQNRVKDPIIGVAGGACGGDILFHEVCQEEAINIPTRLFLAVPKQQYLRESVAFAGSAWVDRFEQLYRDRTQTDDHSLRVLSPNQRMPFWLQRRKNYSIWERANQWMMYHALAYSGGKTMLMALWDGKSGSGPGGTQDMVYRMEKHGADLQLINSAKLFGL